MYKPFDKMMFCASGSMGDSLVTAPIVKNFASMCNQMYVPVAAWQFPTLQTLFEVDSNVVLVDYQDPVIMDQISSQQSLTKINPPPIFEVMINNVPCRVLWDEQWYTYFQLPFSLRYTGFTFAYKLPKSEHLFHQTVKQTKYILVHSEMGPNRFKCAVDLNHWRESAGLDSLENYQIIDINEQLSSNMMDYVDLIRNASEIHCVPSSFFCLVDSIACETKARLFYHNMREGTHMRVNNAHNQQRWCFINYQQKFSGI